MLNSAYSLLVIASTTASFTNAYFTIPNSGQNMTGVVVNNIPPSKRIEYMRKTNEALYAQSGPCPFAAFGAIIVNHTSDSSSAKAPICAPATRLFMERSQPSTPARPSSLKLG